MPEHFPNFISFWPLWLRRMSRNRDEPKEKVVLERDKNSVSFEEMPVRELLCVWITVALYLRWVLDIPTAHHIQNKRQIMCETWDQRCKVFCSQSLCRLMQKVRERLVEPQFLQLKQHWLSSAAPLWKGAGRAPPGFPWGILILRASGWLGRPRSL